MIAFSDVTKSFPLGKEKIEVLHRVNLTINKGDFAALMGPSGSGKSTLMNLIGLLDRPTSGTYKLNGKDVAGLGERQRSHVRGKTIGFVFQTFNLLPRTSVLNNVMLPATYNSLEGRRNRALKLLKEVGLGHRVNVRPTTLSGGERQRVAIARALMMEPEIILADEPTGNLDSKSGREILKLLSDIHHKGTTILLVTHNEELLQYVHRVFEVKDGHVQEKTPTSSRLKSGLRGAGKRGKR